MKDLLEKLSNAPEYLDLKMVGSNDNKDHVDEIENEDSLGQRYSREGWKTRRQNIMLAAYG